MIVDFQALHRDQKGVVLPYDDSIGLLEQKVENNTETDAHHMESSGFW